MDKLQVILLNGLQVDSLTDNLSLLKLMILSMLPVMLMLVLLGFAVGLSSVVPDEDDDTSDVILEIVSGKLTPISVNWLPFGRDNVVVVVDDDDVVVEEGRSVTKTGVANGQG